MEDVIAYMATQIHYTVSATHVEVVVVRKMIELVKDISISQIMIESDCQLLVKLKNDSSASPSNGTHKISSPKYNM